MHNLKFYFPGPREDFNHDKYEHTIARNKQQAEHAQYTVSKLTTVLKSTTIMVLVIIVALIELVPVNCKTKSMHA